MLAARRAFKDFNGDNDSWGEHDMGALDVVIDGVPERIFFKLDYYDLTMTQHSDDAADPAKTVRVLTIMLASEYEGGIMGEIEPQAVKEGPARAYRQGDLDGLCGVYSAINAVRALCPEIDGDDASWLFDHLVRYLADSGKHREGGRSQRHRLRRRGPAACKGRALMSPRSRTLSRAIAGCPRPCVRPPTLIACGRHLLRLCRRRAWLCWGLAGRHEHWTVAVDVSPQQIRLYDIGEISAFRHRHCPARKTASNIRLTPVQVFMIERPDVE